MSNDAPEATKPISLYHDERERERRDSLFLLRERERREEKLQRRKIRGLASHPLKNSLQLSASGVRTINTRIAGKRRKRMYYGMVMFVCAERQNNCGGLNL